MPFPKYMGVGAHRHSNLCIYTCYLFNCCPQLASSARVIRQVRWRQQWRCWMVSHTGRWKWTASRSTSPRSGMARPAPSSSCTVSWSSGARGNSSSRPSLGAATVAWPPTSAGTVTPLPRPPRPPTPPSTSSATSSASSTPSPSRRCSWWAKAGAPC